MAIKMTIMGMNCTHCAQTAEKALAGVEGVDAARVNYLRKEAHVEGRADIEAPVDAVERVGYRAAVKEAIGV